MRALRPGPVEDLEEAQLAPAEPHVGKGRGREPEAFEQRHGVRVAAEADAQLFVERFEERYLLALVAVAERITKGVELRVAARW